MPKVYFNADYTGWANEKIGDFTHEWHVNSTGEANRIMKQKQIGEGNEQNDSGSDQRT